MTSEKPDALSEARRMLAARVGLSAVMSDTTQGSTATIIAWNCLTDEQAIAVINALDERDRLQQEANEALDALQRRIGYLRQTEKERSLSDYGWGALDELEWLHGDLVQIGFAPPVE